MSYVTNYNALIGELQSFVEDDTAEFIAELPNIVNRAVDMVQMALDFAQWRTTVTASTGVNVATLARPALLRIESVFLTVTGVPLEQRSYQYCQMMSAGASPGQPRYWAEKDVLTNTSPNAGELLLSPTPSQVYAVELAGLQRLAALSAGNPTNWVTDNAADLLFTAALIQSEAFLQAPERVQSMLQLFESQVAQFRNRLQGTGVELYQTPRVAAQVNAGAS